MSEVLRIDASEGLVSVVWTGNPGDQNWLNLVSFWSQFALNVAHPNSLSIPIGEFYSKRRWFQTYWRELDLPLEVGAGLAGAIELAEEQGRLFDELSRTGYSAPDSLSGSISKIGLKRPLTTAQTINLASMIKSPNGANFSVPGAGKTATQLALFAVLREQKRVQRMIVVCPKSAFESWLGEPGEMFNNPDSAGIFESSIIDSDINILMVNFEKLESHRRRKDLVAWMSQGGGTLLVIDEAHRVKSGARGIRWRACVELASFATRVDLLTGTPMPQSYEDLRNLFSVSWRAVSRQKLDDEKLSNLKTGGLFVRTTKGQLGLPGINIHRVEVEQGKYQSQIYSALTRKYAGILGLKTKDQVALARKGRAVMTLIAASTNPALMAERSRDELLRSVGWPPAELEESDLMIAIQKYLTLELPPKFEWIARFASRAHDENRKTLVWSSFVGNIELLGRYLSALQPAIIHGGIPTEQRKFELERFRLDPDCGVLITNPQTLGEGVSLHQTAHDAVFTDRTYNAAQYLQALDRIHRLGLAADQETNIYLLESRGTIDHRVGDRLSKKIQTLSEMLNDEGLVNVSLPGLDETHNLDEFLGLDQADLDDLLSHLAGPHDRNT